MFRPITLLLFVAALAGTLARLSAADWPPREGKKPRVIIDTDAANEVDDQYALTLALGRPDRVQIEGIVAAHFGEKGGPKGIQKSFDEIHRVLEKAGMAGKFPVLRGVDPLQDTAQSSDGIDFIIERAKGATVEDPIWLILLGPATNGVAALQKAPEIADKVILFWHGRSAWPKECKNFNAKNDPRATRMLFEAKCRLVLFDTGTHLRMPMEEVQRRFAPLGPLGAYLHHIRERSTEFRNPNKGIFDLGDIVAFVDPTTVDFEVTPRPRVSEQMLYDFSTPGPDLVRIKDVKRDAAFDLLEDALRRIQSSK